MFSKYFAVEDYQHSSCVYNELVNSESALLLIKREREQNKKHKKEKKVEEETLQMKNKKNTHTVCRERT